MIISISIFSRQNNNFRENIVFGIKLICDIYIITFLKIIRKVKEITRESY